MLTIGSFIFYLSSASSGYKDEKRICGNSVIVLEAIAGVALTILGALLVTGTVPSFCSPAGSYALIGMGAFSTLPGLLVLAGLLIIKCKNSNNKSKVMVSPFGLHLVGDPSIPKDKKQS